MPNNLHRWSSFPALLIHPSSTPFPPIHEFSEKQVSGLLGFLEIKNRKRKKNSRTNGCSGVQPFVPPNRKSGRAFSVLDRDFQLIDSGTETGTIILNYCGELSPRSIIWFGSNSIESWIIISIDLDPLIKRSLASGSSSVHDSWFLWQCQQFLLMRQKH